VVVKAALQLKNSQHMLLAVMSVRAVVVKVAHAQVKQLQINKDSTKPRKLPQLLQKVKLRGNDKPKAKLLRAYILNK
jgi:hypothetical protein